ncbi:MAG TPA: biopolymer transporter ExbD [Rhodothermales bacterium]|nr:biopolymer transporter ExbD [Rhodothermales bacterium]
MAIHFERKYKTRQDIPTTSLPDIIFLLLIFFMVSTVMRQRDVPIRTTLPTAEALTKIDQKRLVSYIYIGPSAEPGIPVGQPVVQVDGTRITDIHSIHEIMHARLLQQPKLIVSLRVDDRSPMGIVSDVQQELREAGALNVSYAARRERPLE